MSERVATGRRLTRPFTIPVSGFQRRSLPTYSDWATNCPEYKVTAVQVSQSNGPTQSQEKYEALARQSRRIATVPEPAE